MVCDGLKGLPDSTTTGISRGKGPHLCLICCLTASATQTRRHWPQTAANLKPVYQAPTTETTEKTINNYPLPRGKAYPAMIRLGRNA